MKYLKIILLLLLFLIMLSACSADKQEETYSIIVVSGEENISEKFAGYIGNPVIQYQHLFNLKTAQEKYPKYEIEKVPAILIFEDNSAVLKKLKLKTYDVEEALRYLEDIQNK
ncbi:hypothetical protein [Bacillus dakarensis]|uniref:hypothetical protein n=1 Tax=Robertmurraya dakarensis TaxID=1926278 RepID=UPI000981D8CC|nr:hypothetical protein [Bacillus dakarensis]